MSFFKWFLFVLSSFVCFFSKNSQSLKQAIESPIESPIDDRHDTFDFDIFYPNGCNNLKDGDAFLKLIEGDNYPIVKLKCDKNFMILDYYKENNIKNYFSSWDQWHIQVYGPSNNDLVNWREWFLPDSGENSYQYLLSPDCNTCDPQLKIQMFGDRTTYYMTGTIFGCFWRNKGNHNCDVDFLTDTCYYCDSLFVDKKREIRPETDFFYYDFTGVCPTNIRQMDFNPPQSHYDCATSANEGNTTDGQYNMKPSLGGKGKFCVCAKPQESVLYSSKLKYSSTNTIESSGVEKVNIKLYQSDFNLGTYRIRNAGTYTIMEDIYFDFNSGDIDDPQIDGAWWPTEDQSDDYPGAGVYKDAYFMGFFAGITIETSDVILDLGGYTIQQSENFYYQQRWFVGIELSTQYFLPGQGLGNFGPSPIFGKNVIIKNGIIGLSSHHGIHGNDNSMIILQNLQIRDFETHGIQLSGFNNIELNNIDIGPTSNKVYFSGEYAHMRGLLPRLRKIADESSGETIKFYGRDKSVTMSEIVEEIEFKMNMVWNYVVKGTSYSEDNEDWLDAKRLFYNEGGLPYGAAQYGIFLNTFGASVFTYNLFSREFSMNGILNNVKIHDLNHKMVEYITFRRAGKPDIYINPFTAPLPAEQMFDDYTNPYYSGSIVTDSYLAMEYFTNNWYYLGGQVIGENYLLKWALTGDQNAIGLNNNGYVQISCNTDVMIHSGKGINGLRLDGVKNVIIENLDIYNIMDYTPLGKDDCGEYGETTETMLSTGEPFGHFRQTAPMQIGFSGNMVQGIQLNAAQNITLKNVNVYNLESQNGQAYGIAIWPSNVVNFDGNINIYNLNAGSTLEKNKFTYNSKPNAAPEACAILYYYKYYSTSYNKHFKSYATQSDNSNIHFWNILGHIGCGGKHISSTFGTGTHLNKIIDNTELEYTKTQNYDNYKIIVAKPKSNDNDNNNSSSNSSNSGGTISNILIIVVLLILVMIICISFKYCKSNNNNNNNKNMYEYTKLRSDGGRNVYGSVI